MDWVWNTQGEKGGLHMKFSSFDKILHFPSVAL